MDVTMHDGIATPPPGSPKAGASALPADEKAEDKKVEIEIVNTAAIDLDSYLAGYSGNFAFWTL